VNAEKKIVLPVASTVLFRQFEFSASCHSVQNILSSLLLSVNIIIIFHHEFSPGWPVSVSAVISSSSLLRGLPVCRLPFG
jgi:hypothetical protein